MEYSISGFLLSLFRKCLKQAVVLSTGHTTRPSQHMGEENKTSSFSYQVVKTAEWQF